MITPVPATPAVQSDKPAFLSDPTIARIGALSKYSFLAAVLTRAPTQAFLGTVPLIGTPIQAAAGYVLIFGPLAIAISMWWIAFTFRGRPIDAKDWTKADLKFAAFVFAVPTAAAAFISLQFFLLFAKPGECNNASRLSYLFDVSIGGFQPEYCMGVSVEAAKNMPHLFNPLFVQAWLQVALPALVAYLAYRLWRRWRGPVTK